jgi:hypothetical protein
MNFAFIKYDSAVADKGAMEYNVEWDLLSWTLVEHGLEHKVKYFIYCVLKFAQRGSKNQKILSCYLKNWAFNSRLSITKCWLSVQWFKYTLRRQNSLRLFTIHFDLQTSWKAVSLQRMRGLSASGLDRSITNVSPRARPIIIVIKEQSMCPARFHSSKFDGTG